MKHILAPILLTFLIVFPSSVEALEEHIILGTTSIYQGKYEIISDIKVSNLQIRWVRKVGSTHCAEKSQHQDHLEVNGPINPDTPYIIEKLLNKINDSPHRCRNSDGIKVTIHVFLNSGGGFMEDGYKLGEILRTKHTKTRISPFGGDCYSSCATAFLGGIYRMMGEESVLMFHAPYEYTRTRDIACSTSDEKLLAYMKKMLNETDGQFLYERTMSYCSKTIGWSLNKDAADLFGILN